MSDLLFETAGNPVPENAQSGMLAMRDGIRIRYARFETAEGPLQGTVVLLPGRSECIEKYFETIRDLSAKGLGTATFDLRGQGGSDRMLRDPMRGHVDSFDRYVSDLDLFFKQIVLPDCRPPYYLLAHSTGGLIALLAAPDLVNRIQRMVLIAPLLELINLPVSVRTLRCLSSFFFHVGLSSVPMGRVPAKKASSFETNRLTSDISRYRRNQEIYRQHPELAIERPTAAWVHGVFRAQERVWDQDFISAIRIPTLFIAAGADRVVSTPAIEAYARRMRAGSVLTVDYAQHELLQEADLYREQVLAAFHAFVPGTDQLVAT
ncbi:lysophospholipase [Mesorhizobium sp. J18]|uniref:alpha/beta fold hydrolase n=1 Tax=Mesorhizobium sp. J18 TaxID=935263 RepID=UPI00119939F6|nr:alpha/beta hydrolase [Mesorhizobium sp. J18]TWH00165.1 lysophospholipase [Mesorhizobium sp. J18]